MPKFKVMMLKVPTKKLLPLSEKLSTKMDIQLQKKFLLLIQKLQELTQPFMLKLKVMMLKEQTKKPLLKLERISTIRDIHNQKRYWSLTQRLLELILLSMLNID